LPRSWRGTGHASWIAAIGRVARPEQIFPQFLKGYQAPAQGILYPIAAATVLLALLLLCVRSDPRERRATLGIGAIALGGLVINLLLVAVGIDDLITRNVIALLVPAAMFLAGAFAARRAMLLGLAGAAVLCAIGVVAAVGVATDRSFERPDWRVVARALGARPAAGSAPRAILVQHYKTLLPLSLYMPQLKFWPHHNKAIPVRELDVVAISAPRVHLCWWGGACNLSPTRLQAQYAVPGFRMVAVRRVLQFSVMRLVADKPVRLTPKLVAPALTATRMRADELLVQLPPR